MRTVTLLKFSDVIYDRSCHESLVNKCSRPTSSQTLPTEKHLIYIFEIRILEEQQRALTAYLQVIYKGSQESGMMSKVYHTMGVITR